LKVFDKVFDEVFDTLVIGAGPAGLVVAAIAVANNSTESVCVLERNAEPGRKLLLSGSGQCNVTHAGSISDFLNHYGGTKKGRFVKPSLFAFDNAAVVRFFEYRGVPLWERDDGKVFPKSLCADDLRQVLIAELKQGGAQLQTETVATNVRKTTDGFEVQTNRGTFLAKRLVLATGGKSYPATGSQGDGFRFAAELGHRIIPPKPALTPLMIRNYSFGNSAGFAFFSPKIDILRSGKRVGTGQGDVLLTHRGLSGPGILNLSRDIEPNDELRIVLKETEAFTSADSAPDFSGKKTLKNALAPLGIPDRFLLQILEMLDISPDQPASETNRETRRKIESALTGLPFIVESLGDWNEAMVTSGGVALEEVNRQTMESRLVPGLFFCGEILDIDGDTGGYNIQFALSSGFLTAQQRTSN
jgi:predicted Rossmann fold flavoprotein